jgi:hypothetical protein
MLGFFDGAKRAQGQVGREEMEIPYACSSVIAPDRQNAVNQRVSDVHICSRLYTVPLTNELAGWKETQVTS